MIHRQQAQVTTGHHRTIAIRKNADQSVGDTDSGGTIGLTTLLVMMQHGITAGILLLTMRGCQRYVSRSGSAAPTTAATARCQASASASLTGSARNR